MENSYGFEVSMSCVYNDGEGYDAGINVTTSDGAAANFECSAPNMQELFDKLSTDGLDVILPTLFEKKAEEPMTLEQQVDMLSKRIDELTAENEKLRAQACHCNSHNAPKAKKDFDPDVYRLLNYLIK